MFFFSWVFVVDPSTVWTGLNSYRVCTLRPCWPTVRTYAWPSRNISGFTSRLCRLVTWFYLSMEWLVFSLNSFSCWWVLWCMIYSWFSWNPYCHNSFNYWESRYLLYVSWFSWVLIDLQLVQLESLLPQQFYLLGGPVFIVHQLVQLGPYCLRQLYCWVVRVLCPSLYFTSLHFTV